MFARRRAQRIYVDGEPYDWVATSPSSLLVEHARHGGPCVRYTNPDCAPLTAEDAAHAVRQARADGWNPHYRWGHYAVRAARSEAWRGAGLEDRLALRGETRRR